MNLKIQTQNGLYGLFSNNRELNQTICVCVCLRVGVWLLTSSRSWHNPHRLFFRPVLEVAEGSGEWWAAEKPPKKKKKKSHGGCKNARCVSTPRGNILTHFTKTLAREVTHQGRWELNKGKASVLARLLVFDEADVARRQVGIRCQNLQNSFHGGKGGNVSKNYCYKNKENKKGSTNECRTWLLGEHVGFLICAEKVAYCLHRNLLAAETRHLNRSALVTPRLHSAKTRWGDTKVNVSHGGSYLQRRRKGHMMRMPLNSPTLAAPHLKHFSLFRKLYRPHCDKPRTML